MQKNQLIKEIEDRLGIDYKGFLEEIDDANFIGQRFLPVENVYDYDWVADIFDNTHAVAKMKARGDAEAPIIGGPAVKKVSGSIVPFGQKFQVNKSVLNKIFNPRNDNELKSNLRRILDESARNVRAAIARREWLTWRFLADGVIKISEGDIELEVDMGIPEANKLAHATASEIAQAWDHESAEPIEDLIRLCERYFTINDQMPDTILMRRSTLLKLLNATDTKHDDDGKGLKSLAEVNAYLGRLGMNYPSISTYDEFVRFEDSMGRPTTIYHLIPQDRVVFLKNAGGGSALDLDIGRFLMGPVAENGFQPGVFVDIMEETDPAKYWHYMSCEMWPAGYNPEYIMYADV